MVTRTVNLNVEIIVSGESEKDYERYKKDFINGLKSHSIMGCLGSAHVARIGDVGIPIDISEDFDKNMDMTKRWE